MPPIGEYYGGHGSKVMKSMKSQYGEKKGKQVFYATANKMKAKDHMPSGATQSPSGDIAAHRAKEIKSVFSRPIKAAGKGPTSALPYRTPETANDGGPCGKDKICLSPM